MSKEDKISPLAIGRVLDLTDEKGFLCGKILGDLGADVIKIESPGGDYSRNIGPYYHDIPDPQKSLTWFAYNTSKRGITLNLKTRDGQDIFKQLVKVSDFVTESFPPGYMDELGLGYSVLSDINPKIILTSITPFGQTGPYKDYKLTDLIALAMGGLMYISGDPDRAPLRCTAEQAYCQAGAQAAAGTMIAHYHRECTGEGQWVDVSIQESIVPTTWFAQQLWDLNKAHLMRQGKWASLGAGTKRQYIYSCADGYVCWQLFTGLWGTKTKSLVDWMHTEGMADCLSTVNWNDADMDTVSQEQLDVWEELFQRFFLRHTKAELYAESTKRGIMLFPVNDTRGIFEDNQLAAREFWEELYHSELDSSIVYPGAPFKMSEPLGKISRRAPLIGEHNQEIFMKELGFSREKLTALKQANII